MDCSVPLPKEQAEKKAKSSHRKHIEPRMCFENPQRHALQLTHMSCVAQMTMKRKGSATAGHPAKAKLHEASFLWWLDDGHEPIESPPAPPQLAHVRVDSGAARASNEA